jgi:hypothetical protein
MGLLPLGPLGLLYVRPDHPRTPIEHSALATASEDFRCRPALRHRRLALPCSTTPPSPTTLPYAALTYSALLPFSALCRSRHLPSSAPSLIVLVVILIVTSLTN